MTCAADVVHHHGIKNMWHVQEVVCSVVADGRDDFRIDQNFDW